MHVLKGQVNAWFFWRAPGSVEGTTMRPSVLLLLLAAAASSFFTPSTSTDTIYRRTSLTGNQTLVSSGGLYALGFFTPDGADDGRTYLGIWYASIPGPRTVVWVANRRDPVFNSSAATLQLSASGRLVILDGTTNDTVWSSAAAPATVTNITARATAQLLDTGNFVLSADGSGSEKSVAWQSFDYPTDTLLPGMKLGVDTRGAGITRNITAWRGPSDPSPGDVTFTLVTGGLPQFFLLRGTTRVYTSGPWNGEILTGVPYLKAKAFTFTVVYSADETYYSYFIKEPSLLSRLVVDGAATQLKRFSLNNGAWSSFWYYPTDQCDFYAKCGPFGYCDTDRSPSPCSCLPGFVPRSPDQWWNQNEWSGGCVRSTNLTCGAGGGAGGGDGFWVVNRMKLPQATDATVYAGMTLEQCRQACLGNCSCAAYAAANNSGGVGVGCVLWNVDLLDMRQYTIVVQDVYIRLAQSEIDALKAAAAAAADNHRRFSHKIKLIIIVVATIAGALLLLAAVGCCCFWMKKANKKGEVEDMASLPPSITAPSSRPDRGSLHPSPSLSPVPGNVSEETRYTDKDVDLPLFELGVILAATNNFAEHKRIGAGGFGPVYMGVLEDGQQVAVKRLSPGSTQGVREFMTEVKVIAKLQHRNLVRLLGCCIDNDERMLVYEYLHNQSLDTFIFDEAKRRLLRWQKRFEIILGTARGLQYLHEDSRFRIIHRDLKASNVLLDRSMVPKISDFGVARMFGGDQTSTYTRKVVGTYGYMAPEYAMDGQISIKSDVFSFGVLVLEIIAGRRNRGSYEPDLDVNLLGHAWMLWREGRSMDLIDKALGGNFHHSRVLRCIQVALLCVEAQPRNRPLMSSVVTMLASDHAVLPEPNEPGMNPGMNTSSDTESSRTRTRTRSPTANYVTVTRLEARSRSPSTGHSSL